MVISKVVQKFFGYFLHTLFLNWIVLTRYVTIRQEVSLLPELVYDQTGEYQRTLTEQKLYQDVNNQDYSLDLPKTRQNYGRTVNIDKNLGYMMSISHIGMTRQFVFMTVYEFMRFMAKRNVILGINSAYAALRPEFVWPYSAEFAGDFGLPVEDVGPVLLPIGISGSL